MPPLAFTSAMLGLPSPFWPMNSLAKPSFSASWYMTMWSVRDSNTGSITFSRHCSERLDAVAEPSVSSCVAIGRRYAPSLRTLANIAAEAEG